MKVILKGGPYDGEVRDVPALADSERPAPFLAMPPPLSPNVTWIAGHVDPRSTRRVFIYDLKEVWMDGRLHHYEYHYR